MEGKINENLWGDKLFFAQLGRTARIRGQNAKKLALLSAYEWP